MRLMMATKHPHAAYSTVNSFAPVLVGSTSP
jgi:hypothetical protein